MVLKKLHDIDVEEYLAQTVQIEPLALEEEFVRMPADLAYWNERYARAVRGYLTAKILRERTESRLRMEVRETLVAASKVEVMPLAEGAKKVKEPKAPTVGDIEAAVEVHPEVVAARNAELDAEVEKVRLYGVTDAIHCKRDMLVQLGARSRVEMEHDPVIREQARGDKLAREKW